MILDKTSFRAAVSFIGQDLAREYIADCVNSAVVAILDGRKEEEVIRRFLEDEQQQFRLKYLLGAPRTAIGCQ